MISLLLPFSETHHADPSVGGNAISLFRLEALGLKAVGDDHATPTYTSDDLP